MESTDGGLSLGVGVRRLVDADEEAGAGGARGCGLRVLVLVGCGVLAVGGAKRTGAGSVSYVVEDTVSALDGLGCSGGDDTDGRNGWLIWDRSSIESV